MGGGGYIMVGWHYNIFWFNVLLQMRVNLGDYMIWPWAVGAVLTGVGTSS